MTDNFYVLNLGFLKLETLPHKTEMTQNMWILAVTIYHVLLDQIMSFLSCQILLSDFVHKERFKYFYRAVWQNEHARACWLGSN
jgi:hypothetical protein